LNVHIRNKHYDAKILCPRFIQKYDANAILSESKSDQALPLAEGKEENTELPTDVGRIVGRPAMQTRQHLIL